MRRLAHRLNDGMSYLGGWQFWLTFWGWLLAENLRRHRRRQLQREMDPEPGWYFMGRGRDRCQR